jgi:hypothetical protein
VAKRPQHQLDLLVEQELDIQAQEAQAAGAVWYYTRVMCQLSLPASRFLDSEYTRESGKFHLSVTAPRAFGIPYGIYPRGILNWLVTEAVHHKNAKNPRVVQLGSSLAEFMTKVTGKNSFSGGTFGNIRPFKRQLTSLLASRLFFWIEGEEQTKFQAMEIASSGNLMWHPKVIDQPGLIESTIELGEKFCQECIEHQVPIDIRVIRGLWPDCLAFDIYVWLTYRAFTLLRVRRWNLELTWLMLKFQFGPQYATVHQFRWKFLRALKKVQRLYPSIEVMEREGKGLTFRFKRPSVLSVAFPQLGRNWDEEPAAVGGWHRTKSEENPQPSTHKE